MIAPGSAIFARFRICVTYCWVCSRNCCARWSSAETACMAEIVFCVKLLGSKTMMAEVESGRKSAAAETIASKNLRIAHLLQIG